MGILDFLRKKQIKNVEIVENSNSYDYDSNIVGSLEVPDKLTESNAFTLANTVAEIYFPIDFIADRASKLRYYIADNQNNEIQNTELNRFLNDINPIYQFSELVYQYIFSILSDGNAIPYVKVPDNFKKINASTITRIDILQPDLLCLYEYSNISILDSNKLTDFIRRATYSSSLMNKDLNIDCLTINKLDSTVRETSQMLCKSPLFKAYRSVNNLLATYSARYNVYANNGSAGYLVKKAVKQNSEQEVIDPVTRQNILDDLNQRNGITGRKNFWGISSIPIEFINTLADIQKLMPFEETLENSIKISGIYQIPKELIPLKDNTTFNNKDVSERSVWENTITSIVDLFCSNYAKITTIDKLGYSIKADYSSVSVLKTNEVAIQDINTKKIANLQSLLTIYPEKATEIKKEIEKIILGYGN